MASSAERIVNLDRSLRRSGQTVQIQRPAGSTDPTVFSATANCRASIRPKDVGLREVIISPTDLLNSTTWPDPDPQPSGDPLLPRKLDRIFANGMQLTIQNVHPIYLDNTLVRIELEASA